MILLHENLDKEAAEISGTLNEVYGFKTEIINQNLDKLFIPIPKPAFNGFYNALRMNELKKFNGKALLILTNKDFYWQENDKEEDWVLGFNLTFPHLLYHYALG